MAFMRKYKFALLLALISSNTARAGLMGEPHEVSINPSWRPAVTFSLGAAWIPSIKMQTIEVQPSLLQSYVPTSSSKTNTSASLFAGFQRSLNERVIMDLGVSAAVLSTLRIQGDIWQDADPDFNNLIYSYKANYSYLALKSKLTANVSQVAQPYISGSIGVGFNRSDYFTNQSKLFQVLPDPEFQRHTKNSMVVSLGAGIQKTITEHCSISLGYEWTNWGSNYLLSPANQVPLQTTLGSNHLYTNQLQIGLGIVA